MATSLLVHADVIDIERLDVLHEPVIANLDNLAEGMARDVSVIIDEDGEFWFIDFNDFPSFSCCRKEAAEAIVQRIIGQ